MTRRPLGGRVIGSLPAYCACGGKRRMALVALGGMRGAGVVVCPHCAGDPRDSIEIRQYRMRVDRPRSEPKDVA